MAKRSALVIGIGEYGEGFEPLPGSLQDVQVMERVLKNPERGAFEVQPILQNLDSNAVQTAIEQFFKRREVDDLLLLYFSGHGDLGSGGLQHQRLHLCTRNSAKEQGRLVESSAVSADFLKRQMDLCRSQRIAIVLDCCYSGAIADLLKKGEGDVDLEPLRAKGRVILASSGSTQVSLQAKDGLSLYTRYLIEGMEGAAYPGQGDWIAAQHLHHYAERRFEIEVRGGFQPKIIAEDTGFDLPIVKAPKPDPLQKYREVVDRVFQDLDRREGLAFTGEIIDPLVRRRLEISQRKHQLSNEQAQAIEQEVQTPYQVRAEKRREYTEAYELAVKDGFLPDDHYRELLIEICQDLFLGEADAQRIEQQVAERVNLKLRPPIPPVDLVDLPLPKPILETELNPRYAQLEKYLKTGQWKEANQETYRLMITTVGKEDGRWFDPEDLLNFPCEELLAIDGLWVKYSNGQFGFSVQKKIYLDCGGIADGKYHKEAWDKFCHKVGWKVNNKYVNVKYTSSPPGHLPGWNLWCVGVGGFWFWVGLVSLLSHQDL